MSDQRVPSYIEPYKFRASLGLFFFGALQVLVGILCALGLVLFSVAMFAVLYRNAFADSPMTRRYLIVLPLFSVLASVCLITIGLGSIAGRRWARSFMLASSWGSLVINMTSLANMLATYNEIGEFGHIPKGIVLAEHIVMVLIPAAIVLFYGSKNVKATCEFLDPQERWTDKCPLPVLVVSVLCGFKTLQSLLFSIVGFPQPVFGHLVSGAPNTILSLVTCVALAYLAWGTYKLRKDAWWGALALVLLMLASTGTTYFSGITILDTYGQMALSAHEKEQIVGKIAPDAPVSTLPQMLELAVFIGYLLYVSKYFKENSTGTPEPESQPMEPIPAKTLITRPRLT